MTPDIVVDIGNTHIKWGLCSPASVSETARLSGTHPEWDACLETWRGAFPDRLADGPIRWAVGGVVPALRDAFVEWVRRRSHEVCVLTSFTELPIHVNVDAPERVGIDRLFNAVAARHRRPATPAVLVDIGSAVTVDLLDAQGTFEGGAIFPGFRLMAQALRDFTAQLPLVTRGPTLPQPPGRDTAAAIRLGIGYALAGGVIELTRAYRRNSDSSGVVFLTGGDAAALEGWLGDSGAWALPEWELVAWPEQTLAGIRYSAEALP